MNISQLIKTLQTAKEHVGDVEVFLNDGLLSMAQINADQAHRILPNDLVEGEDFGKLFSADQTILKLG